jgi:hypothetical protein
VARAGGGALSGVFVGATGMYERVTPGGAAVRITDSGLVADTARVLAARYGDFDRTRLGGVLGVSALSFVRVVGFESLEGVQDVGRGVQLALRAGPQLGTGDATGWAGGDLYAGVGGATSFVATRLIADGEAAGGFRDWRDVLASGRVAWYLRRPGRRTLVTSLEYSGGWDTRIPYQLSLADRRAGERGYAGSDVGGGRRLVGRLEERWAFRRGSTSLLGLGAAAYVEAGKLWAGDVPYGATTNGRASVGVALLGAVPRQSRRLLRADLTFPLVREPGLRWAEVRFTATVPYRGIWRDPSDLARARAAAPSSDVFSWP